MTSEDRARGQGLLTLAALGLAVAGCIYLFLALTERYLPYELSGIGVTRGQLCDVAGCRVVGFMAHDRAAFGGTLLAIGIQYLFLVRGPLRQGRAWAWWLLAVSASLGVLTFFAFLGYGYFDRWHALGTVALAVTFAAGLIRARPAREGGLRWPKLPDPFTRVGLGHAVLLAASGGVAVAGLEILRIGVTTVFVPEDLAFMGMSAHGLHTLNGALVPLIAHDRAGFGGATFVIGLMTFGMLWFGGLTRPVWLTVAASGAISLCAAIGTHLQVGYLDAWHLAPPAVGLAALLSGLALSFPVLRGTSARVPVGM